LTGSNRISRSRYALLASAVLTFGPSGAAAHHSRAAFDTSVEVELEGTIAELLWANPHVYFTIETRGADGTVRCKK
jgi:hypothetical protein